jgi:tetrapyrrole methylase family protein/MazG family protein
MNTRREKQLEAFNRLLDIMDDLRVKCPWDRVQTTETLRPMTIEETYELSDAIMHGDVPNTEKELGDVMLHIVFYCKIASEKGDYDIADMMNKLCDKLVYRHPHVYGTVKAETAEQVVQNWEQLKTKEKDGNKTVLAGVPETLPPLIKAYRIQEKARAVGFDWEKREDVWEKVKEEVGEYEQELRSMGTVVADAKTASKAAVAAAMDPNAKPEEVNAADAVQKAATAKAEAAKTKAQGELGDVLFALVNASRLYDLNPDTALEATCMKFKNRFTYVELAARAKGMQLKDMTLEQMDALWDEAKAKGL